MIKKRLLIILSILLIATSVFAWTVQDAHKAVIGRMNVAPPAGATDFTADANCQGAWLFADGLTDASGEGNTLTDGADIVYSTTRPTQYSTPQGKSADFESGDSDKLTRADADVSAQFPGQAQKTDFSVAFWIKFESTAATMGIIGKGLVGGWGIANLYVDPSFRIRTHIFDGTHDAYGTFIVSDTTSWHHVVLAFHGGSTHAHIYVSSDGGTFGDEGKHDDDDGTPLVITNVDYVVANAVDLELGTYSGGNYFDGLLYQPIVFDDLLTEEEAQSIYENGITGNDG